MATETLHKRLTRYQSEVDRAVDFRRTEGYDDLWERMSNLYRGKHYGAEANDGKTKRLIVNMAFATKNVISPSVAVNNPRFTVLARQPKQAPHAVITQEILNYLWRTHKFQRQFRKAVDDMLIFGHGWVKVGYKFSKAKPVEKVVDGSEGGSAPDEDDGGDTPGVDDREAKEGQVETEQRVVDNRPFIERVSPFNIFVDPDAHCLEEARWIAQRVRRAVNDVKVDARYSKAAAKAVTAGSWKNMKSGGDDPHEEDGKSIGYVDIIEFYDIKAGKVCTFAAGQTIEEGEQRQFLIAPKDMPYAFGHPFVMIEDYLVPDHFYPMGELEQIESLQYELNETRTDMLNNRKRDVRKYLIDESRFGQKGMDALKSDVDNTIIPVEGGDNPQQAIAAMPGQGITADSYNMSEIIQADIDNVSATSDYMRGGQTEIRRTATESAMIQDAQNARAADKLAAIEGSLAEIGGRVVQLMQQFLTGKHVARVVGSQAIPIWINYDKDYIKGEFDFEVEGGSTQPRNESFRRQSALQFMDAMAPFMQMQVVDPAAVARKVLQDFGEKDATAFLLQQQQMPGAEMGGLPAGSPPPEAPMMPPPDAGMNGLVSAPEAGMDGMDEQQLATLAQLTGQVGLNA